MLAMAGMALVAGATFSAGPAAASTSTAQGTTAAKQSTQQKADTSRSRDWVEGYYRTRGQCERVGRSGEWRNRWDDYDCERVRRGFRTIWRLEVERDRNWSNGHGNWNGRDHDRGNWNNRDNDGRGHRN
jgi:hypothetical protein